MAKVSHQVGATMANSATGPARVPARNIINAAQVSGSARATPGTSTPSYSVPASPTAKINSASMASYALPSSRVGQPVAQASTPSYPAPKRNSSQVVAQTSSVPAASYSVPSRNGSQAVAQTSSATTALPTRSSGQAVDQTSSSPTASYPLPTRNSGQAFAPTSSASTASYTLSSGIISQPLPHASDTSTATQILSSGSVLQQAQTSSSASYSVPTGSLAKPPAQTDSTPLFAKVITSSAAALPTRASAFSQPIAQPVGMAQPPAQTDSTSLVAKVISSSAAALPSRASAVGQPIAQPAGMAQPPAQTDSTSLVAKVINSSAAALSSRASAVGQPAAQPAGSSTAPAIGTIYDYPSANGTSNIAQPSSTYPVADGTSNIPQWARVLPTTTTIGLGPALLDGKALPSSATRSPLVEYYSESKGRWIPAVFQGFNVEFGTYTLSVQPFARPGDVRLAPEADVEYYSNTRADWVPAKVLSFNEEFSVYALDIQPYAKPEDVRLAGFPEPLQAPCMENQAGVSRRTDRLPTQEEPIVVPATLIAPVSYQVPVQQAAAQEVVAVEEDDPVLAELVASLSASDRFPVGANVEYFDKRGTWLPATVLGFDEMLGTYKLDIQPYALAGHVRIPGILEHLPDAGPVAESTPKASEDNMPVAEDGEGSGEVATPEITVPQFTVQKQREGGRTVFVVFIEANDGSQIRAFDGDCTAFELGCEAEPMRKWLDGISNDLLPGLLTLLQHEVTWRNEKLQEMQEEKDSYHGQDAYEFFGLSEDATEKEITRAYRDKAKELHPDKGGDEEEFADMRRQYEKLKENSGDQGSKKSKAKGEGDPLSWDPTNRVSMLSAHDRMREFLVWVSKDALQVGAELEEMRRRQTAASSKRGTLLDDGQVAEEECPTTSAAPAPRGPEDSVD